MRLLLGGAVFALGMYLAIRMLAALYAIIDLRYTMRTAYPRVVRGVLGWGATVLAIAWLLERHYRIALVAGLVTFVLFYVSLYLLRHVLLWALRRS